MSFSFKIDMRTARGLDVKSLKSDQTTDHCNGSLENDQCITCKMAVESIETIDCLKCVQHFLLIKKHFSAFLYGN